MKEKSFRAFRKSSGITLIALIVTIIVLLILAAVSLSLVTGGNGVLGRATHASEVQKKAIAKEKLDIKIAAINADSWEKNYRNATLKEIVEVLKTDSDYALVSFKTADLKEWSVITDDDLDKLTSINVFDKSNSVELTLKEVSGKVVAEAEGLASGNSGTSGSTGGNGTQSGTDSGSGTGSESENGSSGGNAGENAGGNGSGGSNVPQNPTNQTGITVMAVTNELPKKGSEIDWELLGQIAKAISNNSNITNDTDEVMAIVDGTPYSIRVGETGILNGKQIRIIGFNHDVLVDANAYGAPTATGKAGITFEFAECIGENRMNASNTNSGGWVASEMYTTTMGTYYTQISNSSSEWTANVKAVNKKYIATCSDPGSVKDIETSNAGDKLWLLACSEIWNNGGATGRYGYAITSEGSQYKYYKKINPTYSSSNSALVKKLGTSAKYWWLRSPHYSNGNYFCGVYSDGNADYHYATNSFGVAPGFSI